MGTNYYLQVNYCEHCKRYDEVHLGKCSKGWKFLFRKSENIKNIADAVYLTSKYLIIDEYGRNISSKDFWDMVHKKQNEKSHDEEVIDGFDFLGCCFF